MATFDITFRNPGATFNILLGGTSSSSSSSRSSSSSSRSSRSSSSSATGVAPTWGVAYNVAFNAVLGQPGLSAVCSNCCRTSSSSSTAAHGGAGFVFPGYESFGNIDDLYSKYSPFMKNKTQTEKEDYLISLVSGGEITADQALIIAIREKIDLTT